MAEIQHPQPTVNEETRAYWEGATRGELVLQRCKACKRVQHRPRALCVSCFSDEIEHFVASGRGHVYTCTVTYQNGARGFRDAVPYVLAYVELDEGPRVLANVVGCDPRSVAIGMPVKASFAPPTSAEGYTVPRFTPA
jgi:uncharacterized protein